MRNGWFQSKSFVFEAWIGVFDLLVLPRIFCRGQRSRVVLLVALPSNSRTRTTKFSWPGRVKFAVRRVPDLKLKKYVTFTFEDT